MIVGISPLFFPIWKMNSTYLVFIRGSDLNFQNRDYVAIQLFSAKQCSRHNEWKIQRQTETSQNDNAFLAHFLSPSCYLQINMAVFCRVRTRVCCVSVVFLNTWLWYFAVTDARRMKSSILPWRGKTLHDKRLMFCSQNELSWSVSGSNGI